jgi:hypothetical protein
MFKLLLAETSPYGSLITDEGREDAYCGPPVIVARRMEGSVQVIIDVQVIEPLGQTG